MKFSYNRGICSIISWWDFKGPTVTFSRGEQRGSALSHSSPAASASARSLMRRSLALRALLSQEPHWRTWSRWSLLLLAHYVLEDREGSYRERENRTHRLALLMGTRKKRWASVWCIFLMNINNRIETNICIWVYWDRTILFPV